VVTNAHVVNGGDVYRVFFDGMEQPLAADVVGIAECSDLALLRLEPAEYPALQWRAKDVTRGTAVFAIGYPQSALTSVVTSGAVRASAESGFEDWASVETVIRHTADVDPGNSGGPLLDRDAKVVGVVYAEGRDNPFGYAISGQDATAVIDRLQQGADADSIGINGVAFAENDQQYGVWVVAVQAGSPAAAAGIRRGDILRALNGTPVGDDGSLRSYCEVLRTHDAAEPLAVEVLRPDTNEVLAGTLNGAPLAVVRAMEIAAYPTPTPMPTPTPSAFKVVTDASGVLALNVPEGWAYIESEPNAFGSIVYGPRMLVTTTQRDHERALDVPRVYVAAGQARAPIDANAYLDRVAKDLPCVGFDRSYYEGAEWEGVVQSAVGCGSPDPIVRNALLFSTADDSIYLTVDVYLPRTVAPFGLDELLDPLAEQLLPRVPFWDVPQATVLVEGLNVRSGPGTEYARRDMVTFGETLPVAGKDSEACGWVYINFSNLTGWVSADPQYLSLDRPCAELAVVTPEMIEQNEER
jgi:serine protease Do